MIALLACVLFSIRDTWRLLGADNEDLRGKSPFQVARRRFAENPLAVKALYVIVFLYIVAALAPILAPYDPSAIENVLETRYLALGGCARMGWCSRWRPKSAASSLTDP